MTTCHPIILILAPQVLPIEDGQIFSTLSLASYYTGHLSKRHDSARQYSPVSSAVLITR